MGKVFKMMGVIIKFGWRMLLFLVLAICLYVVVLLVNSYLIVTG